MLCSSEARGHKCSWCKRQGITVKGILNKALVETLYILEDGYEGCEELNRSVFAQFSPYLLILMASPWLEWYESCWQEEESQQAKSLRSTSGLEYNSGPRGDRISLKISLNTFGTPRALSFTQQNKKGCGGSESGYRLKVWLWMFAPWYPVDLKWKLIMVWTSQKLIKAFRQIVFVMHYQHTQTHTHTHKNAAGRGIVHHQTALWFLFLSAKECRMVKCPFHKFWP